MNNENSMELSSGSTGLVIVDMQVEGCERHGPGVQPVIFKIRSLLDRYREVNGKIIHVQSIRSKSHPEFTVFRRKYGLLEGSAGVEFVDALKPLPREAIVQKTSHDCFYKTSMESVLERFDLRPCRDTIVVTGIGSNNCVYHAVVGFHIRDYFTIVPEDCIHAAHAEGQAFALAQFRSHAYNFNINVVRLEDIHLSQEESRIKMTSVGR
ncbi:MAG: isochorismatase family cysteine hydrolase [Gammaproteobacteria bacterium]